jgi:hypothetical protein
MLILVVGQLGEREWAKLAEELEGKEYRDVAF